MAVVRHRARRTHIDRDPQREILWSHLQGTQSLRFLGQAHRRDHSRCAAGTLLIHFAVPFDELLFEILLILEAPHLEEGRFYEAH